MCSEIAPTCLHLPPGERREAPKTREATEAFQCDTNVQMSFLLQTIAGERMLTQEELTILSGSTGDVIFLASHPCRG